MPKGPWRFLLARRAGGEFSLEGEKREKLDKEATPLPFSIFRSTSLRRKKLANPIFCLLFSLLISDSIHSPSVLDIMTTAIAPSSRGRGTKRAAAAQGEDGGDGLTAATAAKKSTSTSTIHAASLSLPQPPKQQQPPVDPAGITRHRVNVIEVREIGIEALAFLGGDI